MLHVPMESEQLEQNAFEETQTITFNPCEGEYGWEADASSATALTASPPHLQCPFAGRTCSYNTCFVHYTHDTRVGVSPQSAWFPPFPL